MKYFCTFLTLICSLVLCRAVDVQFTLADFGLNALSAKSVTMQPTNSTPTTSGSTIIASDFRKQTTSTGGVVTFSNVFGGAYLVTIEGNNTRTTLRLSGLPTNSTATVNAKDYIVPVVPPASSAYLSAGTNILFVTNSGNITIHGTASGGGGVSDATLVTASNKLWVNKLNATNPAAYGSMTVASNLTVNGTNFSVLDPSGAGNSLLFDAVQGRLDIGGGEVLASPGKLELALSGPVGFRLINNDVSTTEPVWAATQSGLTTNYGRGGFRDGITVYGGDAGVTWTNAASNFVATAHTTNAAQQTALAGLTNQLNAATVALTNRADTNYVLANNLSNAVNAANVALSNLAYAIGTASTNFTLARVTNYVTTLNGLATNLTAVTNIFLGSRSALTNADATTNVFLGPVTRAGGITIGPGGNVGIGTNNPGAGLDVQGTIQLNGVLSSTKAIGNTAGGANSFFNDVNTTGGSFGVSSAGSVTWTSRGGIKSSADGFIEFNNNNNTTRATVTVSNLLTGLASSTNGYYMPSNSVTAASVLAGMTNGGGWMGAISNGLYGVFMTNGVAYWNKVAGP